jgi:hypothetical protein
VQKREDIMSKSLIAIEEQLKKQQEKVAQLKAQKQAIESKTRSAELKKRRTEETRRKILIGEMVLEQWKTHPASEDKTKQALDGFLTKASDRALFGLPSRGENSADGSI